MSMNHIFAAAIVVALGISACSKNEPPQMTDCDMQGMDMSKMSAEEHKAMLEKCQQGGAKTDGHTDHSHDSQAEQ
jgi:entry exclusion lipoprotein TrbK